VCFQEGTCVGFQRPLLNQKLYFALSVMPAALRTSGKLESQNDFAFFKFRSEPFLVLNQLQWVILFGLGILCQSPTTEVRKKRALVSSRWPIII